MEDKLSDISKEDEKVVVRYLLEIMIEHGIITKEEYYAVLYKYN